MNHYQDQHIIEALIHFTLAGLEKARSLKTGDRFLGAFGHAAEIGLRRDSLLRTGYALAFLGELDKRYKRGLRTVNGLLIEDQS